MFAEFAAQLNDGEVEPVNWAQARCRDGAGSLLDLFFSEDVDDIASAKAICGDCPLQEACLAGALARREPTGVWGGQLFCKGKVLPFKRKRGRPRKDEQTRLTA